MIAVEVIEHVDDYQTVLAEIARVTSEKALFTMPDAAAIPLLHPFGVVPWHLLEATHFNFFNQTSLERVLREHFAEAHFARISPVVTNGVRWYNSLVAECRKAV